MIFLLEIKDRVLKELTNANGQTSSRKFAAEFEISQSSVLKILHSDNMKPYKFKIFSAATNLIYIERREMTEKNKENRVLISTDLLDQLGVTISDPLESEVLPEKLKRIWFSGKLLATECSI